MSLRLEMLQVARLAPKLLGESADLVRDFLLRQQNGDGGFKDRAGQSDLYYTVFGLDSLLALRAGVSIEQTRLFLQQFGPGQGLDLVHLSCLARGWAALENLHQAAKDFLPAAVRNEILSCIEKHRSQDGGYHPVQESGCGTAYGCFLALGAYQDLKAELPDRGDLARCLKSLETGDGAWTNSIPVHSDRFVPKSAPGVSQLDVSVPHSALRTPHSAVGSTNATAAAVTVLRQLSAPLPPKAGDWLLARCHPQGGFLAAPQAPIPDLLSTATALHALAGLQVSFESVKEKCLDFVDSLWTNEGAFHGHWSDDALDCEYTFYGLLALGHLSL
ncbi:MAG: terpene cyclase/mutase family protein [Chloroflexi bacterium]|nr:terpene cyclase/mutase family protein [Chloroflexota bacterium]